MIFLRILPSAIMRKAWVVSMGLPVIDHALAGDTDSVLPLAMTKSADADGVTRIVLEDRTHTIEGIRLVWPANLRPSIDREPLFVLRSFLETLHRLGSGDCLDMPM
ncbi:hypothetical protein [Thioalkalivibrio sp. HK1]|uniref:hypothetical protein n=1 Tax=Thioalkalivibrio sp. HK1 TaxID=1469245 RepID=UPI000470C627|nr:hypothetical protein [Thioalkalivibrio sp. HK1]